VNLAFHDAQFASADLLGLTLGILPPGAPDRAVPLTPLSLPGDHPVLSHDASLLVA